MALDQKRLARQRQIAKAWWEDMKGVGGFLAATGFGKTMVAMIIIHAMQLKFPNLSVLVVVPTDYLRDQWTDRIKAKGLWKNIRVDTVQSLVKENNKVDLLILDELHSYTSPVFSTIFDVVDYTYILGMTATLREDPEANEILYEKTPIFDEVTIEECLKNGWVSPFTIYNYALELTTEEMRYYKDLSGKFNKAFGFFGHNLSRAFGVLNDDDKAKAWSEQTGWPKGKVKGYARNMVRNMQQRKKFLNGYNRIYTTARDIIEYHGEGRKIVTFSQATDYADKMTQMIGTDRSMSYHSNLDSMVIDGEKYSGKSLRNKIIEMYNSNIFRILNTAKALDQGVDIEDIDTSLVCSGTSSILQAIQRTGRNIRVMEDKIAYEINIYIRDTQSEKWLRKRQRKHPKATIKYVSDIQEIVI